MGRQSGSSNHVVLLQYSSIALLQERFRQLQRAKRMRRLRLQQELFLRTTTSSSSDSDHRIYYNNNNNYDSSELFFQPEILSMIPQPGPAAHREVSGLSLWPNVPDPADADRMKKEQPAAANFCGPEWSTPEIMKSSWPSADHHQRRRHPPSINFSESYNNSDLDTSLYL